MRGRKILITGVLVLAGCVTAGEGLDLPLDRIYYPVGLAMDGQSKYLFVVNSDFDLQFNAGSVQSLSLERIRQLVPRECSEDADCAADGFCDSERSDGSAPSYWCVDASRGNREPCASWGERASDQRLLSPGRCSFVDLVQPQDGGESLLADAVEIKAFASDAVFREHPDPAVAAGRLFIPVRGDSTLHWIDVGADGSLHCGQARGHSCDARHRVGDDPDEESSRGLRLPSEPIGLAATADGSALVVTHESVGKLSLFSNDWSRDGGPVLEYLSEKLAASPVGVSLVPPSDSEEEPERFLVGFRGRAELQTFGLVEGIAIGSSAPLLRRVGETAILANYSGSDSRGIAVDATRRSSCSAACGIESTCQDSCEAIPLDVYIANRAPSSLLVAEMEDGRDSGSTPTILDSVPVPYGPSRVVLGNIINQRGELEHRVFVVSFDAKRIGIFDPALRMFERWIVTGRGPQALLIDSEVSAEGESHALAYVAHFTDSYLGVVQLDQRQRQNYGEIVLTVGKPTAPRGSE